MNGTQIAAQSQGQSLVSAQILGLVSEILATAGDPAFRRRARDFSRGGTLTPDLVIVLLLFMSGDGNRRGYRHILDSFWDQCASHDVPLPTDEPVSASAFCQARNKLSTDLLRRVLHGAAGKMDSTFRGESRWNRRRVFAVDGCKLNLQRSRELDADFGRPEGGHVPMATVSALVNVMTQVPSDVVINRYAACERQMLLDHLEVLQAGDVVVLDRGYPSHEVLRILLEHEIDFLVRVPATNSFEAIDDLRASRGDDYRVLIPPADDARRGREAIELRAVMLANPKGEQSFYLTSLRRAHFSRAQLTELYHLRWQVEELFKLEKSVYFDQRQFHARSALGVRQEILAQAIYVVIARFLLASAANHVDAPYHDISVKSAVLALADYLTRLCLDDPVRAIHSLPRLLEEGRQDPRQTTARAFLSKTILQTWSAMGAQRTSWSLTALPTGPSARKRTGSGSDDLQRWTGHRLVRNRCFLSRRFARIDSRVPLARSPMAHHVAAPRIAPLRVRPRITSQVARAEADAGVRV